MDVSALLPLLMRFRAVGLAVCQAVAGRMGWRVDQKEGYWAAPGVVRGEVLAVALTRMQTALRLLAGLAARIEAGRLQRFSRGDLASPRVGVARGPDAMGGITRRFGWLCPLVQSEAACQAQYMRQVLAEPAMQELLAEVPQAGRILGPVLHMLGIRLDTLMLEVGPAVEAVVEAVVPVNAWAYVPGSLGSGVVARTVGLEKG